MVSSASLHVSDQALAEFCQRNQIRELALFGSFLRHDFGPTSDIDVLVEFEPDAEVGFLTLARLQRELTDLLGRPVDLVPKAGLKPMSRDQVLADAATVYAN